MLYVLKRTLSAVGLVKLPAVGDAVWWAAKQVGGTVTQRRSDGTVIFQGGEIVKNKRGRQVPRWTVASRGDNFVWLADRNMWVIGKGPMPKLRRGTVVTPIPVALSGQVTGSFAKGA